jgi:hypothetical protein
MPVDTTELERRQAEVERLESVRERAVEGDERLGEKEREQEERYSAASIAGDDAAQSDAEALIARYTRGRRLKGRAIRDIDAELSAARAALAEEKRSVLGAVAMERFDVARVAVAAIDEAEVRTWLADKRPSFVEAMALVGAATYAAAEAQNARVPTRYGGARDTHDYLRMETNGGLSRLELLLTLCEALWPSRPAERIASVNPYANPNIAITLPGNQNAEREARYRKAGMIL